MKNGDFPEGTHVVRAKIDMASPNINMRDPTLYRIKHESHQETGDTWCIYPMYDFSHPISDALEGVTHSLCTLEFEDHRPFYDWTIEKLTPSGLVNGGRPRQIEFSRLNIQNTVLSKRKLIQLVENKYVNGWDDPRMPTLSGMRRRGVPPSALRLFCERVGISKADSNIAFSAMEDCVRLEMDETCQRAFCVLKPLKVTLTNWETNHVDGVIEEFYAPRHPKVTTMGDRTIPFEKDLYIERSDFFDLDGPEGNANGGKLPKGYKRLLPDGKVRLRYAYVVQCDEIIRDSETQEPIELKCSYYPDTRAGVTPEGMERVNGIIHWVGATSSIRCKVNQYDRLFLVEEPGKESGDYLTDLNPHSLEILDDVYVEPSVADDAVKMLEMIQEQPDLYPSSLAYQFERSGYFALDKDSTGKDNLVFNRVATLRDNWGVKVDANDDNKSRTRGRGGGDKVGLSDGGETSASSSGPVDDIRRVAFRVATILDAKPHPEADILLVCTVDCGDVMENGEAEYRTVVAGLANKIPLDKIINKKIVTVTNLKPAKVRGVESTAMILAAFSKVDGEDEIVELLNVPDGVPNGELLSFDGLEPSDPDPMMKSKGALKAFDRAKEGLKANSIGEAVWMDSERTAHRLLTSAGPVYTESLKDTVIQ
jgi:glutaminyl-tRNA synthetase